MVDQNINGDADFNISASVNFIAPGIALSASCELNGIRYAGFLLSQDVSERYATNLRSSQDPSNPPSESALVLRTAYDVPIEVRKSYLDKQETFQSDIRLSDDTEKPHCVDSLRVFSECVSSNRNVKRSRKRKNNWLKGQLPRTSRKKLIRKSTTNSNFDIKRNESACDRLTGKSVSKGAQSVRSAKVCKEGDNDNTRMRYPPQSSKNIDHINEQSREDVETILWTAKISNNDSDRTGNLGSINRDSVDHTTSQMISRRLQGTSTTFVQIMKQPALDNKKIHQLIPAKTINDKSKQLNNSTIHRNWNLSLKNRQNTLPNKFACKTPDAMGNIPCKEVSFGLPSSDQLRVNSSVVADQENQITDTPTTGANLKVECNPARVC